MHLMETKTAPILDDEDNYNNGHSGGGGGDEKSNISTGSNSTTGSTIAIISNEGGGGASNTNIKIIDNNPITTTKSNEDIKKSIRKYRRYALLLIIIGSVTFFYYDTFLNYSLNTILQLYDGGLLYPGWADTPISLNMCFYLFDLKNGPEFLHGQKPHLEEIGPFCYLIKRKRRVTKWNDNTVQFMESYRLRFNPAKTPLSLDTNFTTINMPIFATVMTVKVVLENFYLSFIGPVLYNIITTVLQFTGEVLIDQLTPRQLFETRKLPLLNYLDTFLDPLKSIGIPIPDYGAGSFRLLNNSIGIVNVINTGEIGPMEVYSRTENGHMVSDVYSFMGERTLPQFSTECNQIHGSDGLFHPRPVVANELEIFLPFPCRVLRLVRNGTRHLFGTLVAHYLLDPHMFNMEHKRNRCFCLQEPVQDCDGWHSIAPCAFGAPAGLSFPHFYNSPVRQQELTGLRPNFHKHVSFMDIEPTLGMPVNARIGIQAVLVLNPIPSLPGLNEIPSVKYPLMWIEVSAGAEGILGVALFIGSSIVNYASVMILFGCVGEACWLLYKSYMFNKMLSKR